MEHLGFTACLAGPDFWKRPETKSNGSKYYECVLSCKDDALVAFDEAEDIDRNQIGRLFVVK